MGGEFDAAYQRYAKDTVENRASRLVQLFTEYWEREHKALVVAQRTVATQPSPEPSIEERLDSLAAQAPRKRQTAVDLYGTLSIDDV